MVRKIKSALKSPKATDALTFSTERLIKAAEGWAGWLVKYSKVPLYCRLFVS